MKVVIVPYNGEWPGLFNKEKETLSNALAKFSPAIEHIGSTAIVGMSAKPVLDFAIGIPSIEEFDRQDGVDAMTSLGYIYRKDLEPLVPFRRLFQRLPTPEPPGANIHISPIDHPWWRRHLLFRDYLNQSTTARDQYEQTKQELVARDWPDIHAYTDAKTEMILELEEEAFGHYGLNEMEKRYIRDGRI